MVTPDPISAFFLSLILSFVGLLIMLPPFRWVVKKVVKTGTGPSESCVLPFATERHAADGGLQSS